MKKIAIIGAGFAGLACTWHLLNQKHVSITLFDPKGVGGGASGIAAGLMHPYVGKQANRSPNAEEGMKATKELLEVASKRLKTSVYKASGMLRLATTKKQEADFLSCAKNYDDVTWLEDCKQYVQTDYPGILIKSAITVDCPLYLKGLFLACQDKGVALVKKKIESLDELQEALLSPSFLPLHWCSR